MIYSPVNVTTKEYVKALDGVLNDTNDDMLIDILIKGVSSKIANYLNRHILITERTESFDFRREMDIHKQVKGFPVSVFTEVKDKAGTALVLDDFLHYKLATGELFIKDTGLIDNGFDAYSVKYTGGMATDTTDFMNKYAEITYEASMQVIFEFKRKKHMALDSGDVGRNGQDTYTAWGLRNDLVLVCKPHKRQSLFG